MLPHTMVRQPEPKKPLYLKYTKTVSQEWLDLTQKLKPSDLIKPSIDVSVEDYPKIVSFNNMPDNTSQVNSSVPIDQPLFQPSPIIVVFEDYKPFAPLERKIFFRNKDSIARRIKVLKPDSPFFDVSAPRLLNGEPLKQSKIASGMEVYFILTFKPQEVRDYSYDLTCSTEREKFIVPVRAVGPRCLLTFPDEIDFGSCPVKSPFQKKLMIQNVGTSTARFNMRCNNPVFSCPEQDLSIEAGASQQLEFYFTPNDIIPAEGEIELQFLKGATCYVSLTGIGKNADVSLSCQGLTLEPSYISLLSQKSLKIRNMSDAPISFSWKSFSCVEEEEEERERLLQEINRMESLERESLKQRILEGMYPLDVDSGGAESPQGSQNEFYDSLHEEMESQSIVIPFAAKQDEAALVRKYRNLRKALEKDDMQFVDDIFEISPIEGQVWAHTELEVTVCFRPDTAALYNCLAFLDVSGRYDRLPLQLTGQGIGPHASLSFDVLDIGDVFINKEMFYDLAIKNKGDIPASWAFLSSLTRFGNKFQFSPTEGVLKPNETQNISVRFESDVLGEFCEHFRFALQGNEDMLICQIKGHVVGPTFHFDCNSIDFGTVSFDYLHSTKVNLVNTSQIPMVYELHIPQDGTYLKKEFNVEPSHGTLLPGETVEVLVEFIPCSVKEYDYSLAVDVMGVGEMLLSVPITANCIISTVTLDAPAREIEFGDCFIRYPYEIDLKLTNMSDVVHTKFEIAPQAKQTKSVATYETEPSIAVIEPGDFMLVKIRLMALKLGQFKVPMSIHVAGSQEPPIQAVLSFNAVGPKVTVGSSEIRWGSIQCLKDVPRTLHIENEGLITASMKIFLKMARSCYRIEARELVLQAHQSYDLEVVANLDDSVVTRDEIHIVVDEGENLMVPLVSKGIGTTMFCKQGVEILDLGVQLTNIPFEKQIVLENKGRRPQQLKWHNKTIKNENSARAAKAKKLGKDPTQPGQRLPKNLQPVEPIFTVTPEEITLRSRTATTFTFRGTYPIPKQVSEIFVLESKVGKERHMKQIMESDVRVTVVNPLLQFSLPEVEFSYVWERGVESQIQTKPLTLTNTSAIALSFLLKTEMPFNLNTWEHVLEPGQSLEIEVDFDPLYRDDLESHMVEKMMSIHYRGHPQKDMIPLRGEVVFPNLKFDASTIQFGCVMNETGKTLKVRATNTCKIDVNYEWIFLEQPHLSKVKPRGSTTNLPANQVFDILPVRSLLHPGTSEDVEFTMVGNVNSRCNGIVICVVEGGPEYKFPISGESSTVSYELSRSVVDFGKVVFTEKGDEELVIMNHGKVAINFSIAPVQLSGAQIIEILPASGKVSAGQSFKVVLRVRPGLPVMMKEILTVQVAHFDPVTITCFCQGIFPSAVVSLPRNRRMGPLGEPLKEGEPNPWEDFVQSALQNLICPDQSLMPPVVLPAPGMGNTSLTPVFDLSASLMLPPPPPEQDPDDQDEIPTVSLGSSMKGLPAGAMDMEMQRVVLCRKLQKHIRKLGLTEEDKEIIVPLKKANEEKEPENSTSGGPMERLHTSMGLQYLIYKTINLKDIVAASYLCDFGNVIIGQTRKKTFKITNASVVGQMNWLFDKRFLTGSGFSIDPEKVVKLPEGGSIDFVAKFFARSQQKIGQTTNVVPLQNKGSPTVNIVLTANACLPEVELSSYQIDFDQVHVGKAMKIYIGLHNPSPVVANWMFRRPNTKEETRFTLDPFSGSLRPGKKAVVCVEFIPTEIRKYATDFQIRIDQNKKVRMVNIVGEGIGTPLQFDPEVMELGPVLPLNNDDKIVVVHNSSDVPVEFFSLDFDQQFKDEEELLQSINDFDVDGFKRTALRVPGNGLPAEIKAIADQMKQEQEAAALALAAETPIDGEGESPLQGEPGNSEEGGLPAVSSTETVSIVYADPPLREEPAPRDTDEQKDIVLFGPPISGVSHHALQLSRKLLVPVLTVDGILEEVGATEGPAGYAARVCLGRLSAKEQAAKVQREEELSAVAEQSKVEAVEAFKKEKKGKAKEIPEEVYITEHTQALAQFIEAEKPSLDNLAKVLAFRLLWKDVGQGLVVDGLYSSFFDCETVLKGIEKAIPKTILSHISINRGEEGYADWLAHIYESKKQELDRLKKSKEHNRKLSAKLSKPSKTSRSRKRGGKQETEINFFDFSEPVLPVGDESWVDPESGRVLEQESSDFKMLEEKEKVQYLRQLLYQQHLQIEEEEAAMRKILHIWDPDTGLKQQQTGESPTEEENTENAAEVSAPVEVVTVDPPTTTPEGDNSGDNQGKQEESKPTEPEAVRFYSEYISSIIPLLGKMKKPVSKPNPVVSPEENLVDPTADEGVEKPEAIDTEEPTIELPTESKIPDIAPGSPVPTGESVEAKTTEESPEGESTAVEEAEGGEYGLYEIVLEGDESEDVVFSTLTALLPLPLVMPSEKYNLPASTYAQVYRKPAPRPTRKAIKYFQILKFVEVPPPIVLTPEEIAAKEAEAATAVEEAKKAAKKKRPGSGAKEVPPEPEPEVISEPVPEFESRWVVPAQGSVQFVIRFNSPSEGVFDSNLEFEAVGTAQRFTLPCKGKCEYPKVNSDTRNVFMRRSKAINPANPYPQKRFVIAENFFSFGALNLFKKPDWKVPLVEDSSEEVKAKRASLEATHMDLVRVTNSGPYKCEVKLSFQDAQEEGKAVFFVEPSTVELEEGETKDVQLWALPTECVEYSNSLIMTVTDNPTPLVFPVKCWGSNPTVDITGPWTEALEAAQKALDENTDKKKVKELEAALNALKQALTLDFSRILIGKTDTRTYNVTNTSKLPVAWQIDLGEFKDLANVSIEPMSGVIPINTTQSIEVSFTSPEPLMASGLFTMKYSDHEGGLELVEEAAAPNVVPRSFTNNFRVVAEAYKITAVSLDSNSQEEGGSEIDFGMLRVGDYAAKVMKMGNKGKYQIGFRFVKSTPFISDLVTIEPMEGLIETGTTLTDIKVTFCSKLGENLLRNNKDIKVHIFEPMTQEVVEEFPLFVSAHAKYNKFRLQPSKGVSFGAVRFDAAAKVKRVEIRNEGNFEIAYVICPLSLEKREIELLDDPALGVFAHAVPNALRASVLGEHYLSRAGGAGTNPAKKGGKPAKAAKPAKGKEAVSDANANSLNPLIYDPDELPPGTAPEDPLVVGAFSIHPRIQVLQPGQSVGLDMTFDPSGCQTVKERVNFFVSGVDPADTLSQTVQCFDLVGESCVPAIVTGDVYSIFEEQEVVHSLADSTGDRSSEGGGKLEKLAVGKVVYAETEKMLAFGPVPCSQVASGRSAVERIKISNPTKIDIKVKFGVLTSEAAAEKVATAAANANERAGSAKGKKKDAGKPKDTKGKGKGEEAAPPPPIFTVQPETWEIPPHEHRFVNVYFNPTEIKSYRSVFLAEIDDEDSESSIPANVLSSATKSSNSGKTLMFELGGSGTLPCIAIDNPTVLTADGNLLMDFGKLLVSRDLVKKICIRNDGVMPATCLFETTGDEDFIFPAKGTSLTVQPGSKEETLIKFHPKGLSSETGECKGSIVISVLNNPFDQYRIDLQGVAYSCDAIIESFDAGGEFDENDFQASYASSTTHAAEKELVRLSARGDIALFPQINLAEGPSSSTHTVILRSRAEHPVKFEWGIPEGTPGVVTFSPSTGHLGPGGSREIQLSFNADGKTPVKLDKNPVLCSLKKIEYQQTQEVVGEDGTASMVPVDDGLWGLWDDSMKSVRPVTEADLEAIAASEAAWKEYQTKVDAEAKKGKKAKPVGPPPPRCLLELGEKEEDGSQNVFEIVAEPLHELVTDSPEQKMELPCVGVADFPKFTCQGEGENVAFTPTFMFQTAVHRFEFANESNLDLPLKWLFHNIKRQRLSATRTANMSRIGTSALQKSPPEVPCPFSIEPEECVVPANTKQEFTLKFLPLEADDFIYSMKGITLKKPGENEEPEAKTGTAVYDGLNDLEEIGASVVRMVIRGKSKRPVCHFDIQETPDYLSRRPHNMKNENGLNSPIETADFKIVELESVGLRTRNTFRFYITNTTSENYEFLWEAMGEPSPAWRCVQSAGMMYSGKRIEIVFEYLPEEVQVAEAFFKFRIPSIGLQQIILFTGKVEEPKVQFSSSRINFQSVMLGGEGGSETIYLENKEHLPFNFAFDKYSLLQLEGPEGPVMDISPSEGTVPPHGKTAIKLSFHPQEEVLYNFNIFCNVKRKPIKLSLNVKGEGYAVHPFIQLEQTEEQALAASFQQDESTKPSGGATSRYLNLKPAPATNIADFGAVQVLDTIGKTLTLTNQGKYNFDYVWDIESMGPMISLTGGRMGGTLLKAEKITYNITFAPHREGPLEGSMLTLTVAGKYVYNILAKGSGVKPALRMSFMHYDFGPCFTTSPGGSTVIEETILVLSNHDDQSNISVECSFQKTRALWAECPPTVIGPGKTLEVPIRFAPREVKDYSFVLPFLVNGSTKVPVTVTGSGIHARLELVNGSQRRLNLGLLNVNGKITRTVPIVNRSKKALPVQLLENNDQGLGTLTGRCVSYTPIEEIIIAPRETVPLKFEFHPTKRVGQFQEDLLIRYAGLTRKLVSISGKAQGAEVSLDSDSLPFGMVMLDSQKIKKLTLENTGDLTITFQWLTESFGEHFYIRPLTGKLLAGTEISFDVIFKPARVDEDIRQDGITLLIPDMDPLTLTCSGSCIVPPTEDIQTLVFQSKARKEQSKGVEIVNPTDKDWFLSPSLDGVDWKVPHEFKVPAKGKAELPVTYYPLTMSDNPKRADLLNATVEIKEGEESSAPVEKIHKGQLFVALPDGSAKLYRLRGQAGPPECAGKLTVETPAKKAATVIVKVHNWLGETQRLDVSVDISQKPTDATFIVAANATEVGPNGTKEFPVRFVSYMEGNSVGTITFTNPVSGEYCFYELSAKTTMAEVLEVISIESPVRQTARSIITLENPLPADAVVTMGSVAKPEEWWGCDSPVVKVNELTTLSGHTEGSFEVEYRPLKPTEQPQDHLLTITTKELGTFKYKLVLKATPPLLKRILRFEAPLGSKQTESFIFHTFNTVKTDFTCQVKKPDFFSVQPTITVEPVSGGWDGDDVRLNVLFEPTEIGEVKDSLVVSSPEGGEYLCELVGHCIPPLPQGPFNLTQGSAPLEIPFLNCFTVTSTWSFSVDSAAFRMTNPAAAGATVSVAAKTESKCAVVFEPTEEMVAQAKKSGKVEVVTAKLFITCASIPNIPAWIFYLRGTVDPNAIVAPTKGKK